MSQEKIVKGAQHPTAASVCRRQARQTLPRSRDKASTWLGSLDTPATDALVTRVSPASAGLLLVREHVPFLPHHLHAGHVFSQLMNLVPGFAPTVFPSPLE